MEVDLLKLVGGGGGGGSDYILTILFVILPIILTIPIIVSIVNGSGLTHIDPTRGKNS